MSRDAAQVVSPPSLPKGGGAIRSIGDGLGVVGSGGAASFGLALPISPGRGFAPSLSLGYSSSTGNSPFGLGWSKTVKAITRRTAKGVPAYTDGDLFVGPQGQTWMPERDSHTGALVSRSVSHYNGLPVGDHRVVRYWPRIEDTFTLVEHWADDTDPAGFWLLHDADGSLHLYGKSHASRRADPDDRQHVGVWLLDESLNTRGEHIVYTYLSDDQGPDEHQPRDYRAQRYLSQVHYGNLDACDQLYAWRAEGWQGVQWLFHLVFDYGERPYTLTSIPGYEASQPWPERTDPYSSFEYGFELTTRRLCRQVLMFHDFPELGPEPVLVQRLLLEYRETALGYNHLCAAHSQAFGPDGKAQGRPPMEFDYNPFDLQWGAERFEAFEPMPGVNDGQRYQLVDLYGEGLPGILYRDDKAWYYREPLRATPASHADEVAYGPWCELQQFPNTNSSKPVWQFLSDITGDGSLDWVMAQPGLAGFFTCKPERSWSNFTPLEAFPQEFFHPQGQLVDLMGNGLSDLAMIGPRSVRLYANRREKGFAPGQEVAREVDEDALPMPSNNACELVAFSDVMGSGQQHLIRLRHNELKCWPNLGRGRFGKGFVFSELTFAYEEFDASRVLLADLDGSGAADLIYLQPQGALIFINRSGNGFQNQPIFLPWPEGVCYDRFCQVSTADLQGLGCASLVLTVPHMTPRHWRYDFVRAKPYLLCATNNNMGAATTIGYRSSAQEWLDEKHHLLACGRSPVCRLPFPVPVVGNQTQHDEITGNRLTQRFTYREGFYDPTEREWRGFGLLLSTDCEAFAGPHQEGYSAPVLRKTWFHVGRDLHQHCEGCFAGDPSAQPLGPHLLSRYHEQDGLDQITEPSGPQREAMLVALAGQVLRVETFAADGGVGVPYTLEQNRYLVRQLDRPLGGRFAPYTVMLTLPVEAISYHYEQQANDPACRHSVGLRWDAFGQLNQGIVVSYARRLSAGDNPPVQPDERWCSDAHDEAQQAYYLHETLAQFIHLTQLQGWHLGLAYLQRENAWRLGKGAGPEGLTPQAISYEAFSRQSDDNPLHPHAKRVLVRQSVQRYRDPTDLSHYLPLPNGAASFEALADCQEIAELDSTALAAYDLLRNEQGEMPFDLEARLLASGYHKMPWVLDGGANSQTPLWSVKRGFNTYAPLSGFYNVLTVRPTLSHGVTHLGYDPRWLLNTRVQLPDGCQTRVDSIDYRLLLPTRTVDANRTVQQACYGAFGQVFATSHQGTELGVPVGFAPIEDYQRPQDDTPTYAIQAPDNALLNAATAYFEDPFSWMGIVPEAARKDAAWLEECIARGDVLPSGHIRASARQLPTLERLTQARQRLLALIPKVPREPMHSATLQADRYPGDPRRQIRIALTCWDGFGRALQSKDKAEPGDAYQVSEAGALVLDEVGQPITWHTVARWRVSERVEYNNKGEAVRRYRPYFADQPRYIDDACFRQFGYYDQQFYDPLGRPSRTVMAKEGYLRRYTYRPWYSLFEDENDTWEEVLAQQGKTAAARSVDSQTPTLNVIDPRDLAVRTVSYWRNAADQPAQLRCQRRAFDDAGRVVAEWDPRLSADAGAPANVLNIWALSDKTLGWRSVDAGWRVSLYAQSGALEQAWDARGLQRLTQYDGLLRPLAVFEQGCTQRYEYAGAEAHLAGRNLCGRLIRHDDPAGTSLWEGYGMAGQVLEQRRHFLRELEPPNWPLPLPQRDALLEPGEGLLSAYRFNALGELWAQTDAQGNRHYFNQTIDGQLRDCALHLNGAAAPQLLAGDIHYTAQGQIERQTCGNGVACQWHYDAWNGRLIRLRSTAANGERLQDLNYSYDPVGNMLSIEDKAMVVRHFANQRIDPINRYTYDSLYQLAHATGWEAGSARRGPKHIEDPNAVAQYQQTYRYDAGGNLVELIHQGPQHHGRKLTVARYSNRCLPDQNGHPPSEAEIAARYDANGNLLALEPGRHLSWDGRNQLQQVCPVARASALNDVERYIYDADGLRRRKVYLAHTQARTLISETRYLPGLQMRSSEEQSLHVITAQAGLVSVQVLHWQSGAPKHLGNDQYRYHLADHLGSCTLELDSDAQIVSHETYHPFGTTAFSDQSDSSYRTQRYSGKERDATGLYYYGLRYYIPWMQRWVNPDPAGAIDGLNLYRMVRNNPVNLVDPDGLTPEGDLFRKMFNSKVFIKAFRKNPEQAIQEMEQVLHAESYPPELISGVVRRLRAQIPADVSALSAQAQAMSLDSAPQKTISGGGYENMKDFFAIYSTNAGSSAINSALRANRPLSVSGKKVVSELAARHGSHHFEGRTGTQRKLNLIAVADTLDVADMKKVANQLYQQSNQAVSTFYRGQDVTSAALDSFSDAIEAGSILYSLSPLSVSRDKTVAEGFMTGTIPVLMEIRGFSASVMTSSLTADGEQERIFSPHADFKVSAMGTRATNSAQYLIRLEEVRGHRGPRTPLYY